MTDPLQAADKVQRAAARHGFDWPRSRKWERALWAKLFEEIAELRAVRYKPAAAREELGDLLFMVVNIARYLELDAPAALRAATRKFERRFAYIQRHAHGLPARGSPRRLAAMERLWDEAKSLERGRKPIRRPPGTRGPRRGTPPD